MRDQQTKNQANQLTDQPTNQTKLETRGKITRNDQLKSIANLTQIISLTQTNEN